MWEAYRGVSREKGGGGGGYMWHSGDSAVLPHSRRAKAVSSGSGVRF